ncbi:hypothetical protein [Paenibacillus polymyxa]
MELKIVDVYSLVVVNLNLKSSYNLMEESLNKDLDEDKGNHRGNYK